MQDKNCINCSNNTNRKYPYTRMENCRHRDYFNIKDTSNCKYQNLFLKPLPKDFNTEQVINKEQDDNPPTAKEFIEILTKTAELMIQDK